MIVASVSAFAAGDDDETAATPAATKDTSVSITGLDTGDTVYMYQVLRWVEGSGWALTDDFAALSTNADIAKLISAKNNEAVELTKADVEAITEIAKTLTVNGEATTATTYTKDVDLGMYLALVKPVKAGTVYNPIVVSADYTVGGTNTIDSSAMLGESTAVAKKKTVTVVKTEPKITNDIGEEYNFTIVTTIPTYADSFKNTYFNLTDKMSSYLDLVEGSIKVNDGAVTPTSVTPDADKHGFTITFNDAYIKALKAPQEITVTYKAKLNITKEQAASLPNVKEENNKVTVEFPNNPKDDTSKTVLKDETREYTFTIDGQLFGETDWLTSEVIKVGLDQDGYPIEEVIDTYKSGKTHAALNGATFQLYQEDGTTPYTNGAWDCHR